MYSELFSDAEKQSLFCTKRDCLKYFIRFVHSLRQHYLHQVRSKR